MAAERAPGRIGRSQCSMNGLMRTTALWPQNGPQSPSHQACPWCRSACRGACRTGRCARRRSSRACRRPGSAGCRACGVGLHHAHQPHDRGCRHEAVGVERNGEVMAIAKAQTEVAHVAGLVAGVVGAPPVRDGDAGAPRGGQLGEPRLLDLAEDRVCGVAQHIDMKSIRHPGRGELCEHRLEIADARAPAPHCGCRPALRSKA